MSLYYVSYAMKKSDKMFIHICNECDNLEKLFPTNMYFLVIPKNTSVSVDLMEDCGEFDEDLDGDHFSSFRQFKVWSKYMRKIYQ